MTLRGPAGEPGNANLVIGKPGAPGIGIGDLYILLDSESAIPNYRLSRKRDIHREIRRFDRAVDGLLHRFRSLESTLNHDDAHDPLLILQVHAELLRDPQIREGTIAYIEGEQINVEAAFHRAMQEIKAIFGQIDDDYLRARGDDIVQLERAVLQQLRGARRSGPRDPDAQSIVVTTDLAPHELIELAQIPVVGLVTEGGSDVSHTAIVARTFGIPLVVDAHDATARLAGGRQAIIDGEAGQIQIDPNRDARQHAKRQQSETSRRREQARSQATSPAQTLDGVDIQFGANIESPEEVLPALRHGAQAIGLYRTEFLYLNRERFPSTGELTRTYSRVVKKMDGRPVTFRTLDIGGDKLPTNMDIAGGDNPALGLRGIRFSLQYPEWFDKQIKGIVRAAEHGPVRILLPMIGAYDELIEARERIAAVCEAESLPVPPVGVMIETPSSVIIADILARQADFFSVGTNDLVQYVLAVDRGDATVNRYYTPLHPAMLRLLKQLGEVAQQAGIPAGVCGEVAGDPLFTLALLGLGYTEMSMNPRAIPRIHAMVRRSSYQHAVELVQGLMALHEVADIERILRRELEAEYLDLL